MYAMEDKESKTETGSERTKSGRIMKGVGGEYTIHLPDGACVLAKPRGIFRKRKVIPTVGDYCEIEPSGDPDIPYTIVSIKDRKNLLIRPSVANIDVLIIAVSISDPQPDLKLLDKLLILCPKLHIDPVILLTKTDLAQDEAQKLASIYEGAGFRVLMSSKEDMLPSDTVEELFKGHTVGIAGQSGVGKSTLCHRLTGMDHIEVGDISERLKRGKHTTRHVELFPYEGGFLIDTPGFSSLEVDRIGIEEEDVIGGYPELLSIAGKCRFQDCRHKGELGCRVEESGISEGRLARYREFLDIIIETSKRYGK
ncbi:MAG: ribosome small subunit-dependent GTPase A [Clostridiales bacterium]|nr:ribosome small subunit-dependent GTPase A [Clostridiales bacterium]